MTARDQRIAECTLAATGAVLAIGLAGSAVYETYALASNQTPPITTIVRDAIADRPHQAVAWVAFAALLSGWLIGHLGR